MTENRLSRQIDLWYRHLASTVRAFEAKLDNFWKDQPVKFNYREEDDDDEQWFNVHWSQLKPAASNAKVKTDMPEKSSEP